MKEWLLFELSHCSISNNQQSHSNSKRYGILKWYGVAMFFNRYAYHCHMLQEHFYSHSSSLHDPSIASHDSSMTSHDHTGLFTTLLTTLVQLYSETERWCDNQTSSRCFIQMFVIIIIVGLISVGRMESTSYKYCYTHCIP